LAGALTQARRMRVARHAGTGEGAGAGMWATLGEAAGLFAMGSAQ
jgi:hypothetical protein